MAGAKAAAVATVAAAVPTVSSMQAIHPSLYGFMIFQKHGSSVR
jgi:glucose uptake protein GlcU